MATFFAVSETLANVQLFTFTYADERESAWSLMSRVAQAANQRDSSFVLTFDESTKRFTLASGSVFAMSMFNGADVLTKFSTPLSGASTYTSASDVVCQTVQGVRMSSPAWSTALGKPTADGSAANGPTWQAGNVSVSVAIDYDDAFATLKALRIGTWDVVSEGVWLGRIRVTGCKLEPQGRLAGIVEATLTGVAVP